MEGRGLLMMNNDEAGQKWLEGSCFTGIRVVSCSCF